MSDLLFHYLIDDDYSILLGQCNMQMSFRNITFDTLDIIQS